MKRTSVFLILLASSLFINAQIGEKNFIDQNYIEVTGKAEMEITPDLIHLKILISEKDSKTKSPISETEKKMIDKLKEIGVDVSKDLAVKDLVSNFKVYFLIKSDIILSKEYQLRVHDAKTAGKVFIELEKLGISNVSIDKIENSKIEQYRNEVKINAIKAAREKALALASAINQTIGKAIFVQENDGIQTQYKTSNIMIRGTSAIYGSSASDVDIDFEKIPLEYSVLTRFELK
jgi:uncharacterized protein YggE